MKILLMTSHTVIGAYDAPPLGLYRLKNELSKYGHSCDILDTCLTNCNEVFLKAKSGEYDIIGFSVSHNQMEDDIRTIHQFKSACPDDTLFIAGGQEATYNYKEWLKTGIDVVILGYGEKSIVAIANAFSEGYKKRKESLKQIPGIVYEDMGKFVFNSSTPMSQQEFTRLTYEEVKNLMIPYQTYWSKAKKETQGLNISKSIFIPETVRIFTSSHCPHKCGFCSAHRFLSFSSQSQTPIFRINAEQIFDLVLWHIEHYGAKGFLFSDDEFLIDKKRSIAFCDYVIDAKKEGIIDEHILFNCQARVLDFVVGPDKKVDYDFIRKLVKAGFHSVGMGIETFSDRLLLCPSMNKPGYGKKESIEVISAMLKEGMSPHVFIIIFIPETTKEEIIETLKTAIEIIKIGGEVVVNPILRALPGAPIYGDQNYPMKTKNIINLANNSEIVVQTHLIPHDNEIAEAAEKVMDATNKEIADFEKSGKWKYGKIPKTILGILMFVATARLLERSDLADEWVNHIDNIILDLNERF